LKIQSKPLLEQLRKASPLISVGILSADLASMGSEIKLMEDAGAKLLHVDVMDGCFCPMITVGPVLIKAMKTPLLKDVHLMIEEPLEKLETFVAAGADIVTVHAESTRHIHRVLQTLEKMTNANDSDRGILRGIALNPGTPIEAVGPVMDEIEIVFLLAVNPGWRGQKFAASTKSRIARLKQMTSDANRDILVGIDGGITRDNIAEVAQMGADIIVTGSAVFDGKAPVENAKFMMESIAKAAKV
jgi:ribulose-phosphate 3-epimerase